MIKRRNKIILPLLALTVLVGSILYVLSATRLFAQTSDDRGFTVSPLIFELSANPGDKLTQTLKVDNISDQPMKIGADLRNFVARGEEGQAGLTEESTSFALASWMAITPVETTIPAKGAATFTLNVALPLNAEPGGHFGSVVFKTKPDAGEGQISVVQEIGSLVLLKVAGDVKEDANIESFSVNPTFGDSGPFKFELRVKNSGSVHFKPITAISINNMFNRKVADIQVDSRNVLPDSIRKLTSEFKKRWLFGRYTATATVVYGSTNQVLTTQISFWAFPIKLMLIIFAVLAILGVILYIGRRRVGRALKILFGKEKLPPTHPNSQRPGQKAPKKSVRNNKKIQ